MDIPNFPRYDGNIHPDEWINDIQQYYLNNAKSLVNSTISLPTGINSFEELRNALKEDISFITFKNTNKIKLHSLKYIPERKGGNTSKFISNFRKLCYNAEINDIEEQKKYFYQSLLNCDLHNYFQTEFFKRKEKINSMNELIKEFGEIIKDELNLIEDGSIIALKHVATGKYLSSIEDLRYTTGSKTQMVFVGSPEPHPNSLWKIKFNNQGATYTVGTSINLQHVKSNKFLVISLTFNKSVYYKSPSTEHTEVSCNSSGSVLFKNWKFSKLENQEGYLVSNDTINISTNREFLRSHDDQFTIGNNTFQEVFCHNERLGGNDEWRIELIKQNCDN